MRSDAIPTSRTYTGRFAPSPTGPLHFGSLVAAVASYAEALRQKGTWLVRIEDIDPTREAPGATSSILDTLATHGFEFSEPVFQSDRLTHYDGVIQRLIATRQAYPCSCSRKELVKIAEHGRAGRIYPGTCRHGASEDLRKAISVRLRTEQLNISFLDKLQGRQECHLADEIGDFLLRRGDGFVAYQTAVAVDDHAQNISEVVRGTDLLDSTFMQLAVFHAMGWQPPEYGHFPVAVGPDGRKLSKQAKAPQIDNKSPAINILQALSFLLQNPPEGLKTATLADIWQWTAEHWDSAPLQGLRMRSERSSIKS